MKVEGRLRCLLLGFVFLTQPLWAGSSTFQSPVSIGVGISPRGVAIGNVTNLGVTCFLVANFGSPTFIGQATPVSLLNPQNSSVKVFAPSSSGLRLVSTIPTAASPRGLATFDLNEKDFQAVLVTAYDANKLQVYRWNNGQFVLADEAPTMNLPVGVAVGRVRSGGPLMAVVTNYGSNSISLFPIRNGKLGKRVDVPVSAGPTQVVIGDLNGDGINEIAVACLPANKVDLLTKVNGSREDDLSSYAVTSSLVLPEGSAPADLKAVDLNGDGKTDLVIADFSKNTVSIYYQQKDGSLFAQPTLSTSGSHPNGLTVADLNGDGKKEIIVANRDSDSLDIFSPNNAGQYQLTQTLKVAQDTDPTFGPVEVAALDASGHGKLDLVASHMRTNSIRVLPQEGLALPTSAPVSGPGGAVPSSPAFSEQTTYCYPNPARYGKINLCFSLSAPAEVVIRIFDITGKLVWTQTFPDSQTQTGANSIHWAGVNQLGRNLASGLYLYSITVGGQTVTKKIAIIH